MHWSAKYIGLPYETVNCAQLAVWVQRQEFARPIELPTDASGGPFHVSSQISSLKDELATITEYPADGDGVLMRCRGRLNHIGIYCEIDGIPYVLHALKSAGQTCLHKIRSLSEQGVEVEGVYKWK